MESLPSANSVVGCWVPLLVAVSVFVVLSMFNSCLRDESVALGFCEVWFDEPSRRDESLWVPQLTGVFAIDCLREAGASGRLVL